MAAQRKVRYTPEEYLALERRAQYKSEYLNGEIFAMAGASPQHITIVGNLMYLLVGQLRGQPCSAFSNDMRIRVDVPGQFYTYPDVAIICGPLEFDTKVRDVVTNPIILIEVLSDSTEAFDRGKKFEYYQAISSLVYYVMVAQYEPKIEYYIKSQDNQWIYSRASGLSSVAELASIGCRLPLTDVYDKVVFNVE